MIFHNKMPFRSKKSQTYKKRHAFRRRRKAFRTSRPNAIVSKSSPIPDRFFTRLRYSELYAQTYGGLAVPSIYQWRLQSIFDPNLTGVGHQPLGHDQFQLLYNRYRVYGVRYKITFVNQETTRHYDIAILLRPNTVTPTKVETILEGPYCQRGVLGVEGSGQAVRTFSGYCSNPKILGITKNAYKNDDQNQALIGANSTVAGPILSTVISNQNTGDTGTVNVRVELTYYVEFFDRKSLSES